MAKDKKGKSDGKKAKIAEKKKKQEQKGTKKEKAKNSKVDDSDAEDIDLEAVLASYAKQQEQFLKVTEVVCDPPSARSSATLIASPATNNELFLFGGENFNGALATFFNDLYVYNINKDEWRLVRSPNTPLPRSGHAWCQSTNTKEIYLFGGEFSSPKQGTFYHYNDFWALEPSTREWTRLESKGKSPPARSGHRMTCYKKYIILFGGFQDTSQNTKYLSDLWIYDTQQFIWHNPIPTQKPDARSSFSFLPHDSGAVLYGGYSRIKTTIVKKQNKGNVQRNVLKPMLHQDCFLLRITVPSDSAAHNAPPTVRWEHRKKPVNTPNPARAGATMAYHKGRGILFGGVHDIEESEEGIESEFFDGLFAWNIERNRCFSLALRKPRSKPIKAHTEGRVGRKGRGQANEEDLLRNLAALNAKSSIPEVDQEEIISKEELDHPIPEKEMLSHFPHPRFNAQLAVKDDTLYIYGGTYEKGDREFTLDDMYAIDLGKLDGVKKIFGREPENWLGSDIEDSEEDSEDGEDGFEDDFEDDGDREQHEMSDLKGLRPKGNHKSKRHDSDSDGEDVKNETEIATVLDDNRVTTAEETPEDNLPRPRPFESRRDFFQRTGNEWQEVLMTNLRWKGILPESLSIKEIKAKAFEMCEEKWWDCREEITLLEDEQEAAGIGEVVTISDKAECGSGYKRR